MQLPPRNTYRCLQEWWISMIKTGTNVPKVREQRLIYTMWNIWKERYRRVYFNKAMTLSQVQNTITNNVELYQAAWMRMLRSQSR
jgi:hypothetical protein